jgi:hypothetical protein
MRTLLGIAALCCAQFLSAQSMGLNPALKVFIDKMPNELDQYLRNAFTKQMTGRVVIVRTEKEADATLSSFTMAKDGRKVLLWSDDSGDKSFTLSTIKPGGERKAAEHFVSKLKKQIDREEARL